MNDIYLESRIRSAYATDNAAYPAGGIEAVHARRAAGERGPANAANRGRSAVPRWVTIGLATAASLTAVLYLLNGADHAQRGKPQANTPLPTSFLMPNDLLAQATSLDRASLPDSLSIRELDGSRLKGGVWIYRRLPVGGPPGRPAWVDSVEIRRGTLETDSVWLLGWTRAFQSNSGTLRAAAETTFVRLGDLWPLGRSATLTSGYTLRERFTADSSTSLFTASGSSRVIRAPGISSAGGSGVMGLSGMHAMLQTLPFRRDWQGNFRVLGMNNAGEIVDFRLMLRVVAVDTVTVPAGTFDCWRVILGDGTPSLAYWVSRREGWVVRSGRVAASRSVSDVANETVLLRTHL